METAPHNSMLYFYDAQGQRVGKQHADTLEDYVYDPQGHIISVHDGSGTILRANFIARGRHVVHVGPQHQHRPTLLESRRLAGHRARANDHHRWDYSRNRAPTPPTE